jgi:phenylacetate-CoA ligase
MSSKALHRIYHVMPISVQNLAVSVMGTMYRRKRYGGNYQTYVDNLMRSQWLDEDAFLRLQTDLLRTLLKDAVDHVPYYRKVLGKSRQLIENMTLNQLSEIPILEKEALRSNTEAFINQDRLKFGYEEGHTSGTSGAPLVWPYDCDSIQLDLALRERQYRWAGLTGQERSGRFSGRILMGRHAGPPYWRHNRPENQWLFSTYHMVDDTFPLYYEAVRQFDLQFLDGYPSALFSFAKWVNSHGKSGQWRPWAIFSTAETLTEYYRQEIERAFGCKVFNFYSSSEGAPFVTECVAGKMHANPESGIIELLRPDGSQAEPGEEGEMIVTGFFQRSMPLIRYRIGDRGTLSPDQTCPCGRSMPIFESIGGRESDMIYTTERGRMGSAGLSTAFYKVPSRLANSQLEQVGEDAFIFRYVVLGDPLTEDEIAIINNEFRGRLGDSVKIDLQSVSEIPKSSNGKTRLIVGLSPSKTRESQGENQ